MDISVWIALLALFFAGGLTPGPAVMMVMSTSLRYGTATALVPALGISAANLGEADAKLLAVPAGSASLNIERISYLPSGKVVEFTRSVYRADTYDFVVELRLPDAPDGSGGAA